MNWLELFFVAVSATPSWIAKNPVQALGAFTGVAGALLLSLKCRFSAMAWPLWLISNAAWVAYSLLLPEIAYGQIFQQVVFGCINLFGFWTWVIKDAWMRRRDRSIEHHAACIEASKPQQLHAGASQ